MGYDISDIINFDIKLDVDIDIDFVIDEALKYEKIYEFKNNIDKNKLKEVLK